LGKIFKTPSDDAVEETLRMMHTANMVDVAYERAVGWIKVVLFSLTTAFVLSAFEFYTDWNLWDVSGNWIKDTLQGWSDAIF
tara:strand:+ start:492 stop:737 length:246 start_codon:yes stop_codon:yes gene_type:complete